MSLQKVYEPQIYKPDPNEKEWAHETHKKILALVTKVRKEEEVLDKGYVALGTYLHQMSAKQLWLHLGYNTWRDYFSFIEEKFGKGRTSLYGYMGTVKQLQGHVTDQEMLDMGVSRASELKKAVHLTGKSPSEELIKHALNPKLTLPEFREKIHQEFHIVDHTEKGTFLDLGGIYLTPDEKTEFEKAVKMAREIDPVIDHTLSKPAAFKEVLFRWIAEFMNVAYQHSQEAVDGFNQAYKVANEENVFE